MTDTSIKRTEHYCCESEEELFELGQQLAATFTSEMVVILKGTLGAGKTLFVRGVAQGLGISAREVVSPTFAIVQEYEHFVHLDLYRLKSVDEWHELGVEQMFGRKLMFIEWPQLIEQQLSGSLSVVEINITITQTQTRCVEVVWSIN